MQACAFFVTVYTPNLTTDLDRSALPMKSLYRAGSRFIAENCIKFATILLVFATPFALNAQSIEQIRWKGEDQVRQILGEPLNTKGPVGTHARYTMWEYPDFTVAFSNSKAFHLFRKNSLKNVELEENRGN